MNTSRSHKIRSEPHKGGELSKRGEINPLFVVKGEHWFGLEARIWYILLGLSMIISVVIYPNILTRPEIYRLGDVADRDIKATNEFLVEDSELTEKNRQDAVKNVLSVYDFDRTAINVASRIKEAFAAGRAYLVKPGDTSGTSKDAPSEVKPVSDEPSMSLDSFRNHFFGILDIPVSDKVFDTLLKTDFSVEAENAAIRLVSEVLNNGVVGNKMMLMAQSGKGITLHRIQTEMESKVTELNRFYDLKGARDFIEGQSKPLASSMSSPGLAKASLELAAALVKPNLTFNKRETELRKELARKSVTPFYFKVKKGEMLVREGERITPEHLLKVSEQQKFLKQNETLGRVPAMAVLIFFLLAAMHRIGFMTGRASKTKVKDLLFNAFTLLTIFLVVMACNFMSYEIARGYSFAPRALIFAIPVASGAMLVAIFHGMGVAASFAVIISILASRVVGGQVEFFVYFFIGSLVAAHGVRDCRERGVFIKTGLKVGLCNMALALSIEAMSGPFSSLEFLIAMLSAFVGGIFVAVIATGLLPLIEMSFGYTTDIKFLELGNLDQPLLRELMVQAPGTYHHSVIVSNMVEATAKAVNANPLLAKVAAYYHDIGKIKKPLYFIENQMDRENKHEKLAPSMSSLILTSHVKDGVEMAKKEGLGREIMDIIRQHHGTSLISYFYEKAKEQEGKKGGKSLEVEEEVFRYPGPKPQTKEAGLVMLADVVEAASKTLFDPTAARIQGMVQKIINKVFSDGQLDECELTLKDLHEIAKSFNMTLSGIFHHRIEYPEPVAKTTAYKKGENGDTDQLSAGDFRAKKTGDKTESDESLKRLGLS
jgi:putative nucleotidyltransferase with HDIG domain